MDTVVAIIPARGGSKGVPGKNIAPVGGVPLVARAVRSCLRATSIDVVVVTTDDDEIAAEARKAGARVVQRPTDLSGDGASSESAILHALDALADDGLDPLVTVFVQCTSPFIAPYDLDVAVRRVRFGHSDVVFSAVETYEFLWSATPAGARGINHDAARRPRRQDRAPHFRETGAFYVFTTDGFREHRHRFFGRIDPHVVPAHSGLEIDSPEDLTMARATAPHLDAQPGIDVDAVVTDFDGVHTDDTATLHANAHESVTVSRSDGMGVALLRRAGIPVLILSTETNPIVGMRAAKLKVPVQHGLDDKRAALDKWIADQGLDPARVAYVGNDVNDLDCLAAVGWPIAVPDSHPLVLAAARVVLTRPGGHGAVRELCDRVLSTKGNS